MAGQDRGSSTDVKEVLKEEGHRFSLFQVLRLLQILGSGVRLGDTGPPERERVRLRPALTFAFPATDVVKVEEGTDEGRFLVTVSLLGLYGTSSPLPSFYTEELFDEASEDESVSRDFLDIFHHRLLSLLYRCWARTRLHVSLLEEREGTFLGYLLAMVGLGTDEIIEKVPDPLSLIRYLGLFTQWPRSVGGVKALVRDIMGDVPAEVIPCVRRWVKIPEEQRLRLGSATGLGEGAAIGEVVEDRSGKFAVRIGPVGAKTFHELLPEGWRYQKMVFLIKLYLLEPLDFDVEVLLKGEEVQGVQLGRAWWSSLGWDTWLLSGPVEGELKAYFK